MIRFIDLRGQITQDNTPTFAFYDTTVDEFLKFDSSFDFDSVDEFIDYFKSDKTNTRDLSRFLNLIPKNFFSESSVDRIKGLADELTDEERYELISNYCKSCGDKNPRFQCWNDE